MEFFSKLDNLFQTRINKEKKDIGVMSRPGFHMYKNRGSCFYQQLH